MTTLNIPKSTNVLAARRFLPWLLLLFVGSGCAALIYEIVWLQKLSLVIGSSSISLGVLLGTFMGGMCLGSLVLPRLTSKRFHPLRVYAFLELGIGACGLAIIFGMDKVAEVYINYPSHGILIRAGVAAVCLILPTLLMGATLPAIARWVESTPDGVSWMGFFYGGNIVGAVVGCLTAGFVLLPLTNMYWATSVAVVLNVLVSVVALILASQTPHVIPTVEEVQPSDFRTSSAAGVYVTIALSGLCALGAEVIWTRLLSLMLGATVYTFSIILAVFLVGLGIGSSVGAAAARNARNPRAALGWCQLMLAGAIAWASWVISCSLPYWPVDPSIEVGDSLLKYQPYFSFQLDLVRCAWAVLPGAILWGASFPLALGAVASREKDPGKMVGGVYAANTVGAIIGALAFSMLIVPAKGTVASQQILIVISVFSAVIALLPYIWPGPVEAVDVNEEQSQGPTFSVGSLVILLLGLGLAGVFAIRLVPVPWVAVAFGRNSATWLKTTEREIIPEGTSAPSGTLERYCTYVGEGMNVSVAVTKSLSTGAQYFHGAGKVQASSDPQDMRLQRMLGHLSVLAHQKPDNVKDVLVVACGAGVTAGSFVPYPHVENIVICDIEKLVPTVVTPKFSKENYGITDGIDKQNPKIIKGEDGERDKNVKVVYDDGRHYIRTLPKDKKFDIITSDPIDPWVKGCAALNTVEYYQMCRDHLNPGGVMSLWIPLYESNLDTAKSVIATFFKVFPNGILFTNDLPGGEGYDAVLFGRVEPTTIDVDEMHQRLERPEYRRVKESLMYVNFGSGSRGRMGPDPNVAEVAADLLSTYAGRGLDLGDWMKDAQINEDRNLRLQYLAGMWLNSPYGTSSKILNSILEYYQFPETVFTGSPERLATLRQALQDAGRERHAKIRPTPATTPATTRAATP